MKKPIRFISPIFAIVLFTFLFGSCKKENDDPPKTEPGQAVVYIAGYQKDENGKKVPTLWKDGVATALGAGGYQAEATSVFVIGNDVYVAGYIQANIDANAIAMLWKNGVATSITDGTKSAAVYSVFVSGEDVYVAGYELLSEVFSSPGIAKVWKNGVATDLTDGSNSATANAVTLYDNDIYVVGEESSGQGHHVAKTWKNGIVSNLTSGNFRAGAYAVAVSDGDVYVAGRENSANNNPNAAAKYWKNGVATNLFESNPNEFSIANAIVIAGSDIFVGGELGSAACIWKNGEVMLLPHSNTSFVKGLFKDGDDLYAVGSDDEDETTTAQKAVLWKNGIATIISNPNRDSQANSVFVVH